MVGLERYFVSGQPLHVTFLSFIGERRRISGFGGGGLLVRQLRKLVFRPALLESSTILAQKSEQRIVVESGISIIHLRAKTVEAPQEFCFAWQILVDRVLHARVKEIPRVGSHRRSGSNRRCR